MLNLKIYLIMGVLVASMAGGFYVYFRYSQDQLQTLASSMEAYKIQAEQTKLVADRAQADVQQQVRELGVLSANMNKIAIEARKLGEVIDRHDLEALAADKSKTIERLSNAATRKIFRELVALSQPIGETK